MSIGSDLKSSLTGNIETALLVIHDYRSAAARMKSEKVGDDAILLKMQKERSKMTAAALGDEEMPSFPGSEDKILRVQFNPSQLSVYASAIPKQLKDTTSEASKSASAEDIRNLTLTVKLQFDDMDIYDAFMWEKFTAGLTTTGITNAVKAVSTLKDKEKVHTVQWQVEALIAALRNPYTRTISFRWADFVFIGQLNAVQAQYTMFSPSGRPIRAEVLLRIRHEMDPAMLRSWYKNFDEVFNKPAANLVKPEQNYAALLNLSL